MNQPHVTAAATPRLRSLAIRLLLVSTAVVTALMVGGGFASASVDDSTQYASAPATQVLGIPVGTAVWALLGAVGLIAGVISVRRSRRLDVLVEAEASLLDSHEVALAA